jgi:hypothetical protein
MNRSLSKVVLAVAADAWQRFARVALFLSFAVLLAGCGRPLQRPRTDLDLRITLPPTWEVDRTDQLDTDGDGELEWVICYTFDVPGNKDFVPIRCAIYDIARREPKLPVIYPYHLQAPGWTYLGEGSGNVSVMLENVVTQAQQSSDPEALEVIVTNEDADEFVNRVSIFRWRDSIPEALRKRTDPHEVLIVPSQPPSDGEWYECLGMFESTLQISVQVDQVTVIDRTWEDRNTTDRSQLARVNVYRPDSRLGGYLDESHNLVPPTSTCIDFAHGMPADVADSPYPEKVVMAFQKTFMVEPDYGNNLLTPSARNIRQSPTSGSSWDYFSGTIAEACVQIVSYGPSAETAAETTAFNAAEFKIQSIIRAQVETLAVHEITGQNPPQEVKATWSLIREEQEQGQQGRWKIESVTVNSVREIR